MGVRGRGREDRGCRRFCQLCWSSNCFWLAGTEGDDAPDRIVRRDANGHAIARDYLDAEAAHSAAELSQHLMPCVALHAVKTAAVDRDHGALHINEIILAQLLARPSFKQTLCHIGRIHTIGDSASCHQFSNFAMHRRV